MYELNKNWKGICENMVGPGPCLMKKKVPDCGLTTVEKHWHREV